MSPLVTPVPVLPFVLLAHLVAQALPLFPRPLLPALPGIVALLPTIISILAPVLAHLPTQLPAIVRGKIITMVAGSHWPCRQQQQHGEKRNDQADFHLAQHFIAFSRRNHCPTWAAQRIDRVVIECFLRPAGISFVTISRIASRRTHYPCRMNENNQHILVVDDDARLRDLLTRYLGEQGFVVKAVGDAQQMEKTRSREHYHLIVLDLMLPGEDGLSICRRLRGQGDRTPIIMLTAKGDEVDRIVGLEMGADDYLPKPFNPRELLARIHAVMRRQGNVPPGAPEEALEAVRFGNIEVDFSARTLKRGDEILPLTTGEFAVLKVLLQHPRQPLSRDKLMTLARGREQGPFDRAIDVQVSRLRKLIENDPSQPRYLQTVWGFGYVFMPDGAARES